MKEIARTEWLRGRVWAVLILSGGCYRIIAYRSTGTGLAEELSDYAFESVNALHAVAWFAHIVAHITERVQAGTL